MFKLSANIIIKSDKTWQFKKVASVEIERNIDNITSTCTITLPKNTKWADETKIPVKRGDGVTVSLGYDDNLTEVFTGYIRKVAVGTPVKIECEDEMFTLKNTPAKKKTYATTDLAAMLKEQVPSGITVSVFKPHKFGQYIVNSDTVAQLLGSLNETGIRSYFIGKTLYCGILHDHTAQANAPKQVFKEGVNIIDVSSLEYNTKDEIRLRIKATGTDAKGKKISVEVGDKEGELRTYFAYKVTKEQLKQQATAKLEEWKVAGLSGDFTTFGYKPVRLLERIKAGTNVAPVAIYTVTGVKLSYSDSGYRQTITIGGSNNE